MDIRCTSSSTLYQRICVEGITDSTTCAWGGNYVISFGILLVIGVIMILWN